MDGQISLKEANAFVRKQFQGLMKRHGFLKNKRTGFYVRIQSGFVQIFILRFLRSLPQIECLLLPAFLYANGHLPYMEARYIRLKEQLDLKESIFFADIALPGPPGGYHLTQFERVWNANHRVLEELLIPYLDQLDFEKRYPYSSLEKMIFSRQGWAFLTMLRARPQWGWSSAPVMKRALRGCWR